MQDLLEATAQILVLNEEIIAVAASTGRNLIATTEQGDSNAEQRGSDAEQRGSGAEQWGSDAEQRGSGAEQWGSDAEQRDLDADSGAEPPEPEHPGGELSNDAENQDYSDVASQISTIAAATNPQPEDSKRYGSFTEGVEYMMMPRGTSSLPEEFLPWPQLHEHVHNILKSESYTTFKFKT